MTLGSPVYFGPKAELFGWYHEGARPRRGAVLVCPPLGHEYMASYRALRVLAEALAADGLAVFRLEYYGTGNSAGGPHDAGLVEHWRRDVALGIDALRARAGDVPLMLAGLRFGATLAADVANGRSDLAGLVLWEPCADGEAYVRQLKQLASMMPKRHDALRFSGVDAVGFAYGEETVHELRASRLQAPTNVPSLLLLRDDLVHHGAFAQTLRARGVPVQEETFGGYATFMQDPLDSELPVQAIASITRWCSQRVGHTPAARVAEPPALPAPATRRWDDERGTAEETAHYFDDGLFGVWVRPSVHAPHKPLVVLLNTGVEHHVGPHRIYVPMTRAWASEGIASLRVDLHGIGASARRDAQHVAYPHRAVEDVRAIVRHVQQAGYTHVLLSGICSGAYHGLLAASQGVSVFGIIAVNPPLYFKNGQDTAHDPHWNEAEMARIRRVVLSAERWWRLLRGEIDYPYYYALFSSRVRRWARAAKRALSPRGMSQADAEPGEPRANGITPSGAREHFIFSVGDPGYAYFERAFLRPPHDALPMSYELIEDADHTFMAAQAQARLARSFVQALTLMMPDDAPEARSRPEAQLFRQGACASTADAHEGHADE